MKTNTLLLLGGAGVAAYFLLGQSSSTTATVPGTTTNLLSSLLPSTTATSSVPAGYVPIQVVLPTVSTVGNVPTPPATYNQQYFATYIYPVAIAFNPNLTNPNYHLTTAELNQYAANFPGMAQTVAAWTSNGGNLMLNLQSHWTQYGVAQKLIFIPFLPINNGAAQPPAVNAKAKSGNVLTDALSVVSVATPILLKVLGPDPDPQLNYAEVELLMNGSYIAKSILPFFYALPGSVALDTENAIDEVLTKYA
jgi:hypothetical protein